MKNKMKITLFSFSCCDPQQGVYDQEYMEKIKKSLDRIAVEAKVNSVAATDALYGLNTEYIEQLRPLFEKYGMAVAPVLFINDKLILYGTIPSIEKLVEVIEKSANESGS